MVQQVHLAQQCDDAEGGAGKRHARTGDIERTAGGGFELYRAGVHGGGLVGVECQYLQLHCMVSGWFWNALVVLTTQSILLKYIPSIQ
jgi:hypothetical protein